MHWCWSRNLSTTSDTFPGPNKSPPMLLNVKLAICAGITTNLGDRSTHLLVIICASGKVHDFLSYANRTLRTHSSRFSWPPSIPYFYRFNFYLLLGLPLLKFHRLPPLTLYQTRRLPSLVHQTFPPHFISCLLTYFSMLFHPNLRSRLHSLHLLLVHLTCSRSHSLTTPPRGLASGQSGIWWRSKKSRTWLHLM